MTEQKLRVTVLRVRANSTLVAGSVYEGVTPFTIGRDRECDLCLSDETVSHRHVSIAVGRAGIQITNLSKRGTTFVNRARIEPNETVPMADGRSGVQLGGVLLAVEPLFETREFEADLVGGLDFVLEIDIVRGAHTVLLAGVPVQLSSRPVRALTRLALAPEKTVSQQELLQAADEEYGGGNPNQLITYVRNALRETIEAGEVDVDLLRSAVAESTGCAVGELEQTRVLLRQLLANVRGAGYRLCLPPTLVLVTRSK